MKAFAELVGRSGKHIHQVVMLDAADLAHMLTPDEARKLATALQRAATECDAENRTPERCTSSPPCDRYSGHGGMHGITRSKR